MNAIVWKACAIRRSIPWLAKRSRRCMWVTRKKGNNGTFYGSWNPSLCRNEITAIINRPAYVQEFVSARINSQCETPLLCDENGSLLYNSHHVHSLAQASCWRGIHWATEHRVVAMTSGKAFWSRWWHWVSENASECRAWLAMRRTNWALNSTISFTDDVGQFSTQNRSTVD